MCPPIAAVAKDPREAIRAKARDLGFDAIGFTRAELSSETRTHLQDFLAAEQHGDMSWLASRAEQRAHPQALWPAAKTVISLGLNYTPADDPLENLHHRNRANISVYARHRDYHDVMKGMLKHLAQFIVKTHAPKVKVFVDTAPIMEKPLAERAGLGWQGKHTNLVSRQHGSWLFLGEILTTLDITPDKPHADHCGTCTACQTICPTQAFPAPYRLDATRCISYLTIEHPGPIPHEFRKQIGNRIYGCDDCLAVCPWNRFAQTSRHAKLNARADLTAPCLADLATLTDAQFRQKFTGSPIKRIGRDRFIRNVAISIGNSADITLIPIAQTLANDPNPIVAEAAQWAVTELSGAP